MNAVALLVGTIVGAGIFALPEVSARAGFFIAGAWLVLLAAAVSLLHLMFGEIVLRTEGKHRLPGYAGLYLGKRAGQLGTLSAVFGGGGSLLVYIILSDLFLTKLFPVFHGGQWGVLSWCALVVAIAFGIRTIGRAELLMTVFLIIAMGIIVVSAAPHIHAAHFFTFGGFTSSMLPYGVFLFALWGVNAIPEMRELFPKNAKGFAAAIFFGTMLPAFLYAVFITATVGAFGGSMLGGFDVFLALFPPTIAAVIAIFGVLAVATSFLVLGAYLVDVLRYDLHFSKNAALFVLMAPLCFFVAGARDVLATIGIVGVLLGTVDGALISLSWRVARKRGDCLPAYTIRLPAVIAYAMIALLFGGTAVEIFSRIVV